MNYHKGFIAPLLLALGAILLIGGGAYLYLQNEQTTPKTQPSSSVSAITPIINSIASTTDDHGGSLIAISGSNFIDLALVEYLNNGQYVDAFCSSLKNNKTLTIPYGPPEGGWTYYSNVNQLRVISADCRTVNAKSDLSGYPNTTVNINMTENFPTLY